MYWVKGGGGMIRLARQEDIPAVVGIYDKIHSREEQAGPVTGWRRGIYPTRDTAMAALEAGELYVLEEQGRVLASGRINGEQESEYADAHWQEDPDPARVLVIHTLTVDPAAQGRGLARQMIAFYEDMARSTGRPFLRIDTNVLNTPARSLYRRLGYREAGVVGCTFNGLPGVRLVCLEKVVG